MRELTLTEMDAVGGGLGFGFEYQFIAMDSDLYGGYESSFGFGYDGVRVGDFPSEPKPNEKTDEQVKKEIEEAKKQAAAAETKRMIEACALGGAIGAIFTRSELGGIVGCAVGVAISNP